MQLLKTEYYELPQKYNQTVIRLLVQSPTRMFAYWEVSDDTIREFNKHHNNYSDCVAVLKVTNLTHNYSYSIPVSPFANNYYIEVEDCGCNYKVELGRMEKKGFINIYTSNVAMVPTSSPSPFDYSYLNDGILFANYLCVGDTKKIKIYGSKEQYATYFANQSHTAFEKRKRFLGSSEMEYEEFEESELFNGSSDHFMGSSERYMGSSEQFLGSSENVSWFS